MANVKVARWLFRLSGLARRTGLSDTRLGRGAARAAAKLLRAAEGLPASALRYEVDGFTFTFPRDTAFVFARPDFERGTRRLLAERLRPGMTAVDVGANAGFLTAWMARAVGPSGKVYAVEPAPGNLVYLRHNVEANDLAQVEVLPVACGAAARLRSLYLSRYGTLHSFHDCAEATGEVVEVAERPLDALVSEPVDLVKIDAEGAELEVLSGMSRLISQNPRLELVVEWNPPGLLRAGLTVRSLPEGLRAKGFAVYRIEEPGGRLVEVDPLIEALETGRLPDGWFANLYAARVRESRP